MVVAVAPASPLLFLSKIFFLFGLVFVVVVMYAAVATAAPAKTRSRRRSQLKLNAYHGEIFRFMPHCSRLSLVDYFEHANTPVRMNSARDYNMWCAFGNIDEYRRACLRHLYGVGDAKGRVSDTTVRANETLTVCSSRDEESSNGHDANARQLVVCKSGIPIARESARTLIAAATNARLARHDCRRRVDTAGSSNAHVNSDPIWLNPRIVPFIYVMRRRRTVTTAVDNRGDAHYSCFVRVLENGIFVKISFGDILKNSLYGARLLNCCAELRGVMSLNAMPALSFEKKCLNAVRRLLTTLRTASDISTEMESLEHLLRMAYGYNECFVVAPGEKISTRASSWKVDQNGRYVRRIAQLNDVASRAEFVVTSNTTMMPRVCTVANCSLVPKPSQVTTGTVPLVAYSVCFRHSTIASESTADDCRLPDVTYNFCRAHAHLIVSAWYLMHMRRTWTADFYEELRVGSRRDGRMYNTAAEGVYQYLDRTGRKLGEYKSRCDASFHCVLQFTRNVNMYLKAHSCSVRDRQQK